MKENEDWFRKILAYEPRGSEIMSCTIITEPCTPGTDVGVHLFWSKLLAPNVRPRYDGRSGCTDRVWLSRSNRADYKDQSWHACRDREVEAKVEDGVAIEVSFINAPALVLNRNVAVETKDYGRLTVDISWGGNVYAILPLPPSE